MDLEKIPESQAFSMNEFDFSATSLAKNGVAEFDDWVKVGEFIRLSNVACQWWWGDWLNMGEDAFGERSSQALESTRWDEETLRVYAWVCRNVPASNRLPGVPFSHYLTLAKLPVQDQKSLAEQARDQQWSRNQLKKAIDDTSASEPQTCVLVRCTSEQDASIVEEWAGSGGYEFDRVKRRQRKKS